MKILKTLSTALNEKMLKMPGEHFSVKNINVILFHHLKPMDILNI